MQTPGAAIEVLTDDELSRVVGGTSVSVPTLPNAQRKVYEKLGMCGCGGSHAS